MEITHIITTRFNTGGIVKEPRYLEWFGARMEVFNRLCVSSINAQTDKNFKWLIFVDPETPQDQIDMITENISEEVDYEIVTENLKLKLYIKREYAGLPCLISTRLDNDDGIATDFVEYVNRKAYESPEDVILDFRVGYQLRKGVPLNFKWNYGSNILSFIEFNREDPKTVWWQAHPEMAGGSLKGYKVQVQQIQKHFWVQNIDGYNARNHLLWGRGKATPDANRFVGVS